ncbi:MAG TPA: hypothetical protein VGN22_02320 [Pseudonocardia sp.]
MKAPTAFEYRPGRRTAAVGAVVAVGAAGLMGLVAGTATTTPPGRCVENVNVRAEPDAGAPVVALCRARSQTRLGATHGRYVELTDLGGWAALQYVSSAETAVAGPAPSAPDQNVALTPRPRTEARG